MDLSHFLLIPHLLINILLHFAFSQFPDSDHCALYPDDPICRFRQFEGAQQRSTGEGPCQYQDLWLIPGKADSSCTRPNPKRLAKVDARHVKISPPVIKLPGCFTVEIKHIQILDNPDPSDSGVKRNSIFAKTEYQWLNAIGASNSKCQNASVNGCGGFGNDCYYCDICESLSAIDEHPEKGNLPAGVAEQLQNMKCPDRPGVYTFHKQFCFNDWQILDANKDCRLDFVDPTTSSVTMGNDQGLRAAMASLQQVGYGTVVAKVRLAYNATPEIERKKAQKEEKIERTAKRELERRRANWDARRGGDFAKYSEWLVERRKGKWHKKEYLPWLLYENEIACIRLTFDVCERPPQQNWDGGPGSGAYTCI